MTWDGKKGGGEGFVAQKAIREQKGASEAARSNNVDVLWGFLDKLLAVQSFLIAILAALFTIEHLLAVIVSFSLSHMMRSSEFQ